METNKFSSYLWRKYEKSESFMLKTVNHISYKEQFVQENRKFLIFNMVIYLRLSCIIY